MNKIEEVLQELDIGFDKHLKQGAEEYGTTYPPHPELKAYLKASQKKLIEAIIEELHTFDKRYGNSVDSIKVLVDVTELLQDSISNK